jgi:hypothetical protein
VERLKCHIQVKYFSKFCYLILLIFYFLFYENLVLSIWFAKSTRIISFKFHAISHVSKQLIKHEKNYSPFLLEMDTVVWAMKYYQEHQKGRRFIFYTDHKPRETLGTLNKKQWIGCKCPWWNLFMKSCLLGTHTKQGHLFKTDQRKCWLEIDLSIPNAWMVQKGNKAVLKNNIVWINKNNKLLFFIPFEIRQ